MDPLLKSGLITMEVLENLRKIIWDKVKRFDLILGTDRFVRELAQDILDKLPELGFIRLEDVEINEGKIDRILMKYEGADTDEIAHAIVSAKGIIKVKEGKE